MTMALLQRERRSALNNRNWLLTLSLLIGVLALNAQAQEDTSAKATSQPQAQEEAAEQAAPAMEATPQELPESEGFVAPREEVKETATPAPASRPPRVVFNPQKTKDPTLSPDDIVLLEYREKQRLAALEAERKRKLEEERKRLAEEERRRQLELELAKDPTRAVRNKFKVGGVIGQEVFIGDKIYTVGNTIFGARIVEVHSDYVIFSYKGHRFRKNVQL